MDFHEEVFYFYGWLDERGAVLELRGEAFAGAPDGVNAIANTGLELHRAVFWQGDPHISNQRTPEIIRDSVKEALNGKKVFLETDFFSPQDRPEKIKLNLIPQVSDSGSVSRIFFSAINITPYINEAAYYKERSEQLLFAAETAEIGLFFWDLSKGDIFTTPKFNELYGLSSDEIMTQESFSRVIFPDDVPLLNETVKRSHANFSDCNVEYRVVINDEIRWMWIRGRTFPGTDKKAAFTMGSGRDVTKRKLADQELAKLMASEKLARDEVEKANQAKDHFIAVASHELRAPLNSIMGWVQILLTKQVDDETRQSALETIERSSRMQAKLIGDLVDSSKIMSGKLNLEFSPVEISGAIDYIIESQKPAAAARNIEIEYSPLAKEVHVNADLARLHQIFTNLMTNAIKFTPDGGKINVDLKREQNAVNIRIKDTGKGIEPDELPYIFERYFQARVGESGDKSGLGLGLSIVSSLVRQHGGNIVAESKGSGKGASFTVTLPVMTIVSTKPAIAEDKKAVTLASEPLDKVRILLVEDNDDSREVLEIFLQQMGAEITSACSAAEAMASLNSNSMIPHVLVSDISMPEEDGYSLLRRIRNLPPERGGNMPAIALTAFAGPEDKRKVLESGFQVHHAKPFEPARLIKEILESIA